MRAPLLRYCYEKLCRSHRGNLSKEFIPLYVNVEHDVYTESNIMGMRVH